ncbi:hypothetical protein U3516DRAFT_739299 [Neocallimastix sp. 'constans']
MKLNFLVLSISNVLNENKNEINKDLMIEAFIKIQKKKKTLFLLHQLYQIQFTFNNNAVNFSNVNSNSIQDISKIKMNKRIYYNVVVDSKITNENRNNYNNDNNITSISIMKNIDNETQPIYDEDIKNIVNQHLKYTIQTEFSQSSKPHP